jgi:sodium transport system ATP-binding protein
MVTGYHRRKPRSIPAWAVARRPITRVAGAGPRAPAAPWHVRGQRHDGAMLALESVEKSFYDPGRGEVRAIDGVTLAIGEGVTALIGANGAGKSTLLRLVTTLLSPDRGRVLVAGLDTRSHAQAIRARLGYLSSTTRMYPRLTGRELLAYSGGFFGLRGDALQARVAAMDGLFDLGVFLDQRIDTLSTGQLQRINLARTLLADPDLLILDEPTTGLDVLAARAVVEAVRAARRPGRLTLFATHVLREVELAADHLLVMRGGRLAYSGAPQGLGSGEAFEAAVHALLGCRAGAPPGGEPGEPGAGAPPC